MAPVPLTIAAGSSIAHAARLMRAWDVPDVLVTERGRLVGTLTEREVVVLAIAADAPPSTIKAGDACDAASPRLHDDQPLAVALEILRSQDLRYVPVLGRRGRLLGCLWLADAEAAEMADTAETAEIAVATPATSPPDDDPYPWSPQRRAAPHEPAAQRSYV
jgi:predicted transcriptional regulator